MATVTKPAKKIKTRRSLPLMILNILLLFCMGFVGFYTIQKVRNTKLEPETSPSSTNESAETDPDSETAFRPIGEFKAIWKRNLFNTSQENVSYSKKKITPDSLAPAGKDLGLKLLGTVLADNPKMSLAVIDNLRTKLQDGYREGDMAGDVLIKKVLRNQVVITTDQGDMLLSVEDRGTFEDVKSSQVSKPRVSRTASTPLSRQWVKASQADIEQLMKDKLISPYVFKDKTYGFRFDNIPSQSVLREMGLESQDIILGVNGRATTDPKQAANYFRMLDKAGEASITILRRRRSRILHFNVE